MMRMIAISQINKSSASAPLSCAREKLIIGLRQQQQLCQLLFARAHERAPARFKNRDEALPGQTVHRAQSTEIVGHIPLIVRDTTALKPRPRPRA